jgi:hypothetical protein
MITAFSKVVTAVIAALSAAPAVCDVIYRARPSVVPDQTDAAVSVQWESALPNRGAMHGAPVDWSTRVTVECFARGTQESGDLLVDPLLSAVYARLAEDSTLGQLVSDLECIGVEAENTSDGKKTGWVRLTYLAQHRTDNLNVN